MKRLLILTSLLICSATTFAQNASERVSALLASGDCPALNRYLPVVRDSLTATEYTYAKAVADAGLRRYTESNAAIGSLLDGEAGELDEQMQGALINQLISNYRLSGDNASAAELIKQLRDADPKHAADYAEAFAYFNTLAGLPQPRLERPAGNAEIPFRLDSIGRGMLMVVDVQIGGRTEPFIFDTGCAEMSFASDAFARAHGIRPTGVELSIAGVTGDTSGWLGIADSLSVGGLVLHNAVFAVAPTLPTDSLIGVSAVLGCNFMLSAGEIRFCGTEHKIIVPAKKTPAPYYAPNMSLAPNGLFYAEVDANGEPLRFQFDSGNVKSGLSNGYYARHREQIEAELVRDTLVTGGIGGMLSGSSYVMPHLALRFGDTADELTNVQIAAGQDLNHETGEDGSLGVDFLLAFDRVTVDYDRMFIAPAQNSSPMLQKTAVRTKVDPTLPRLKNGVWHVNVKANQLKGVLTPKAGKPRHK